MSRGNGLKIFSGTAHPEFAASICKELGVPLADIKHYKFSDGELGVSLNESVRGADVYLIQPTCEPTNDNLMQLLIMADAAKRDSAHYVNAVIPYFGYARQDRKAKPREPITYITSHTVLFILTVISTDSHPTKDRAVWTC